MLKIKKFGFTLSEILIAMTILGVIAAMTVPRVMNNSQAKANVLKLKRAYIAVQEALRISSARAGYDMADITLLMTDSSNSAANPYNARDLLSVAFDAVVKTVEYTGSGKPIIYGSGFTPELATYSGSASIAEEGDLAFAGRNSALYVVKTKSDMTNGCTSDKPCIMYIDINGQNKGPNEIVMCTSGNDNSKADTSQDTLGSVSVITYTPPEPCVVDDSAVTDIYPFFIYDADIKPATSAVSAVLDK